jgi:hypothetical protein
VDFSVFIRYLSHLEAGEGGHVVVGQDRELVSKVSEIIHQVRHANLPFDV